jgi:hypothetical protein
MKTVQKVKEVKTEEIISGKDKYSSSEILLIKRDIKNYETYKIILPPFGDTELTL